MRTIRYRFYCGLMRLLVRVGLLRLFFSPQRALSAQGKNVTLNSIAPEKKKYWFHAASAGELESLISVVVAQANPSSQFVISVMSESSLPIVEKIKTQLLKQGVDLIFIGPSPVEGFWEQALSWVEPDVFVVTKYEAWPELWGALSLKKIPLFIVGARLRGSLKTASRALRLLGVSLPQITFATAVKSDQEALQGFFPSSKVALAGDPRWDRVFQLKEDPRFQDRQWIPEEILAQTLPRPWLVMGSVWAEDLAFWGARLQEFSGTIWMAPRRIDSENISRIEQCLEQVFKGDLSQWRKTSPFSGEKLAPIQSRPKVILCNEQGRMMSLYSEADAVYVGGGFTKGIHNTMEPAVFQVPVSCGPLHVKKFSEAILLQQRGVLDVLTRPSDLDKWLKLIDSKTTLNGDLPSSGSMEDGWINQEKGATERLATWLDRVVNRSWD